MESGEKELRKAFEDVTTNNVKAVLEHTNATRRMMNETINRIRLLEEKQIHSDNEIISLKQIIARLQGKIYILEANR